jgi:hypothetical protein
MVPRTASSVQDPAGETGHVFRKKPISDPGSGSRVKTAPDPGYRIPDPDPQHWCNVPRALSRIQLARRVMCSGKKPIPDPGSGSRVKKAPDPGSGSATLVQRTASSVQDPAGETSHVFRKKAYSGSRIPDPGPGLKRHRIPDPDPQHWCNVPRALSRIQLARRVMCSGSSLPRSLTNLKLKKIFPKSIVRSIFFFLFAFSSSYQKDTLL